MNIKNVLPFLMIINMINAECESCYSDESLQELQQRYEQEAQKLLEYQILQIIKKDHTDIRKKFAIESTKCNMCREYPKLNSYFIGASEDNCKAAEQCEKEIFELEELRKYAQDKLDTAMPFELKELQRCLLQRKYACKNVVMTI